MKDFVNKYYTNKKNELESKFNNEFSDFEAIKAIVSFIVNEIENGLNFGKKIDAEHIQFKFDKNLFKAINIDNTDRFSLQASHACDDLKVFNIIAEKSYVSTLLESYTHTIKIKYPQ
ncbi:MAG: hypothetical protein PHE32_03665 [Candidatus Shapirobacteria bacterium]|nr:hypothetical protein [Candidatus Shapirobacteria bacterium]MDD4410772.1 hypothetical protein [Candidatus Shapirobacteria bacterium]